jgi:two-component system phosphate regulon sensor histidine kinase PhoR
LQNYVNIIRNETTRLRNQVDKLLQIAKMESDKVELHEEVTDLHTLIKELAPNLAIKVDEENGQLTYSLDARNLLSWQDGFTSRTSSTIWLTML